MSSITSWVFDNSTGEWYVNTENLDPATVRIFNTTQTRNPENSPPTATAQERIIADAIEGPPGAPVPIPDWVLRGVPPPTIPIPGVVQRDRFINVLRPWNDNTRNIENNRRP